VTRVVIVDTGLCNLDSIRRALEECGGTTHVTTVPEDLARADRIVLPGVGAFGDAMANLRSTGLHEALPAQAAEGVPLLGVCLGMQLLATSGTEGGEHAGLGLVPGTVVRLVPDERDRRVPHVGWNEVDVRASRLLDGVAEDADFYFVHSYHLQCDDERDVAATTPYCGGFVSVVERGNVVGTQFHPEKSQRHGFAVLRSFVGGRWC